MPNSTGSTTAWGKHPHKFGETAPNGFFSARGKENKNDLKGGKEEILKQEQIEEIKKDVIVLEYVDYSSKYGVGYLLSDSCYGVFFNDSTKILYDPAVKLMHYIDWKSSDKEDNIISFSSSEQPPVLQKKVTLLQHFKGYLTNNLDSQKPLLIAREEEDNTFVKKWMWTKHAVIFWLSNKIVQVIFFDNTQIVLHSERWAVTYVNKTKERLYFSLSNALKS